jgi:proteasome accessory factor A
VIVKERLFGIETEYALTVIKNSSSSMNRESALKTLMDIAAGQLVHLPGHHDQGLFTENGARFYVDCGLHPEWATPECSDPRELVRYVLAGESILLDMVERLARSVAGSREVLVTKCNVDYAGTSSTWGCHESYLYRADPAVMPEQIIPHLVTRQVYTGAGGFDSLSNGLDFRVSARVPHLTRVVSHSSTSDRGIFHSKDESLSSRGYHRLHILCGESLCSEMASWLKTGVTALVVLLVDAGVSPGEKLQLQSPLDAMRAIAADRSCRTEVRLVGGHANTAIQIQREYLEQVRSRLRQPYMPAWAEAVCRGWENILNRLEAAPQSVEHTLDWAIKHSIFRSHAEHQGFGWEEIPAFSDVLVELKAALAKTKYSNRKVTLELVLAPDSPIRSTVEGLHIESRGLTWERFGKFLDLRRELFEIDTRFGQLGPRGIFAQLDAAEVLDHHVPGVRDIETAKREPPELGRARLRGQAIRRLAGKPSASASWSCVHDADPECFGFLDLSDPFTREAHWSTSPDSPALKSNVDETRLWDSLAAHSRELLESLRRR